MHKISFSHVQASQVLRGIGIASAGVAALAFTVAIVAAVVFIPPVALVAGATLVGVAVVVVSMSSLTGLGAVAVAVVCFVKASHLKKKREVKESVETVIGRSSSTDSVVSFPKENQRVETETEKKKSTDSVVIPNKSQEGDTTRSSSTESIKGQALEPEVEVERRPSPDHSVASFSEFVDQITKMLDQIELGTKDRKNEQVAFPQVCEAELKTNDLEIDQLDELASIAEEERAGRESEPSAIDLDRLHQHVDQSPKEAEKFEQNLEGFRNDPQLFEQECLAALDVSPQEPVIPEITVEVPDAVPNNGDKPLEKAVEAMRAASKHRATRSLVFSDSIKVNTLTQSWSDFEAECAIKKAEKERIKQQEKEAAELILKEEQEAERRRVAALNELAQQNDSDSDSNASDVSSVSSLSTESDRDEVHSDIASPVHQSLVDLSAVQAEKVIFSVEQQRQIKEALDQAAEEVVRKNSEKVYKDDSKKVQKEVSGSTNPIEVISNGIRERWAKMSVFNSDLRVSGAPLMVDETPPSPPSSPTLSDYGMMIFSGIQASVSNIFEPQDPDLLNVKINKYEEAANHICNFLPLKYIQTHISIKQATSLEYLGAIRSFFQNTLLSLLRDNDDYLLNETCYKLYGYNALTEYNRSLLAYFNIPTPQDGGSFFEKFKRNYALVQAKYGTNILNILAKSGKNSLGFRFSPLGDGNLPNVVHRLKMGLQQTQILGMGSPTQQDEFGKFLRIEPVYRKFLQEVTQRGQKALYVSLQDHTSKESERNKPIMDLQNEFPCLTALTFSRNTDFYFGLEGSDNIHAFQLEVFNQVFYGDFAKTGCYIPPILIEKYSTKAAQLITEVGALCHPDASIPLTPEKKRLIIDMYYNVLLVTFMVGEKYHFVNCTCKDGIDRGVEIWLSLQTLLDIMNGILDSAESEARASKTAFLRAFGARKRPIDAHRIEHYLEVYKTLETVDPDFAKTQFFMQNQFGQHDITFMSNEDLETELK